MFNYTGLILFSFLLWFVLLTMIFLSKLKYYTVYRNKEVWGIAELLYAGVFLYFPILGNDNGDELINLRKKANKRLMIFYGVVLLQIILVIVLNIVNE